MEPKYSRYLSWISCPILILSCFGVFCENHIFSTWFYIKIGFCIRRMHDGFACRKKVRVSVDTCILNMYAGICEYSAGRARLQWVPIATMSLQPSARQRFSEPQYERCSARDSQTPRLTLTGSTWAAVTNTILKWWQVYRYIDKDAIIICTNVIYYFPHLRRHHCEDCFHI